MTQTKAHVMQTFLQDDVSGMKEEDKLVLLEHCAVLLDETQPAAPQLLT